MTAPLRSGLVVASHGRRVKIVDEEGERFDCAVRRRVLVVTGDRVRWRALDDGRGVVEARLTRTSVLTRADDRGRERPIAANVDRVLVVLSLIPAITSTALDAYLVAAASLQLNAGLVFNKWDLLDEREKAAARGRLGIYDRVGYDTYPVSAQTGTGLDALRAGLAGRTSVIVGPSGVGKSSLTRRLVPDSEAAVGELTRAGTLGSHTTTASNLYFLPSGGAVIDSPGIREFGLGRLEPQAIAGGFPEIRTAAEGCRFRDCLHRSEPDCAVRAELGAGRIDAGRFASYGALLAQYAS